MKIFLKKQLFTLLLFTIIGSTSLFAQANQALEQWQVKRIDKIAQRVGLTATQKAEVIAISEAHVQKVKAARTATYASPAEKKATMRPLQASNQTAMLAVFTPEQKAKWEAWRAEKEKKGKKKK